MLRPPHRQAGDASAAGAAFRPPASRRPVCSGCHLRSTGKPARPWQLPRRPTRGTVIVEGRHVPSPKTRSGQCLASEPPASRQNIRRAVGLDRTASKLATPSHPVFATRPCQQADRASRRPWAPVGSRRATEVTDRLQLNPHPQAAEAVRIRGLSREWAKRLRFKVLSSGGRTNTQARPHTSRGVGMFFRASAAR